jgi:hypothetical protein
MDATYAWMLRRQGPVRTRAVAFMNVAGATGRTMLFRVLSRRWPERFEPLLDENIEWRRLHRIGLAPRGRIGTLSAAGPSGHRD